MALTNTQYDAVMRHYDEIREAHRHEQREHLAEIYQKIPEIKALDDEVSTLSLEAAKARVRNPESSLTSYRQKISDLSGRRVSLLQNAGYPADYTELQYDCPICRDRGVVGGKNCVCFDRFAAEFFYGRAALADILMTENFEHFSFDWYSDKLFDGTARETPREAARIAYLAAQSVCSRIGQKDNNLYLYGTTGVGKTFLAHCIAKAVLDEGYSVLFFSAPELFDSLADSAFGRDRTEDNRKRIQDADLVIIDDLGTEMVNSFTLSEFFRLIDGRITRNRSTVISSNLGPQDLKETYSERIFSRVMSHYEAVKLSGKDIRLTKALEGGS